MGPVADELTFDQINYERWPDKIDQMRVKIDGQWCWMKPEEIAQLMGVDVDHVVARVPRVGRQMNRDLEGVHNYFSLEGCSATFGRRGEAAEAARQGACLATVVGRLVQGHAHGDDGSRARGSVSRRSR
jgi:hypothetical protein